VGEGRVKKRGDTVLSNIDKSHNTPRDFFLYLLSVITLYAFFTSLIAILFKIIDIYFSNPVLFHRVDYLESIRWHIAILLITFPVYIYTSTSIRLDYSRYPEKRNLMIRKWLLYFTLFLAAIVIMFDLGTIIYYFLGGDLTLVFCLKTIVILLLVSAVFFFYLRELHRGWQTKQLRIWTISICAVVIITLLYGFYLAGSPSYARKMLIDKKRVSDLRSIQTAIIQYWQQKQQLPSSLSLLTNSISGFKAPTDPSNQQPYSYRALSTFKFELCATFATQAQEDRFRPVNDFSGWNWSHPAGLYCFQRTIDPELYKNKK
jgi:hypothetical protein